MLKRVLEQKFLIFQKHAYLVLTDALLAQHLPHKGKLSALGE